MRDYYKECLMEMVKRGMLGLAAGAVMGLAIGIGSKEGIGGMIATPVKLVYYTVRMLTAQPA